ncbi:MAG: Uma2 family endonuclease [Spirochaetaceae bacterium]|jgi:Uma2 family endonuclease|nr:Uma2 family endonuclease [Spirochaetaceae bacterium]
MSNALSVEEYLDGDEDYEEAVIIHGPRQAEMPHYTYADYESWNDNIRREIIDGVAYEMAAPNGRHQRLLGDLFVLFHNYLEGKECTVWVAPYDVRLFAPYPKDEDEQIKDKKTDDTVVQPDLIVSCDRKKHFKEGAHGAPDFVLEILSPSSKMNDNKRKKDKYLEAGVREYWILDPDRKELTVFKYGLENDIPVYHPQIFKGDAVVPVGILDNLSIDLSTLFIYDEAGRRIE